MARIFLWVGLTAMLLACPTPAWGRGASARLVYDAANDKINSGDGYKDRDNATGTLAWGEAYIMMSYAEMFRGTGDPGYLVRLADHALSVLAQRDGARGLTDYAGQSRPCWQATKYSANSEPYCWVVHSGMISYPMADLVYLVGQNPGVGPLSVPGGHTLESAAQQVLAEVEKVVATHDFQYNSGPDAGEGHYEGDPAAASVVPTVAGKALPLNQMNAMGRTLVLLWRVTGQASYLKKAAALASYLRNRMTVSGEAYVWTYWGDAWTGTDGEDISHAAINADFAALCHAHGLVFDAADMRRLGRTLFDKIHRDAGAVADRVDGTGTTGSYNWAVGRWLAVAPFEPRAWAVAANLYRGQSGTSSGSVLFGLAAIARHAPPLREHTFYHVDWDDLGDHRKATAANANILILPPVHSAPYALKLGYRAVAATSVDQWDGGQYHANQRLPATAGSDFVSVYVPYDPAIYYPYSGTRALYQFTGGHAAGQGIEVQEAQPVVEPEILTTQAPAATVGQRYELQARGTGDAPLLWRVAEGPIGMTIGLQSGLLSWTPEAADLPGVEITLELVNDSGEATENLLIAVRQGATDGGLADAASDARPDDGGRPEKDAGSIDPDASGRADAGASHGDGGEPVEAGGCGCSAQPTMPRLVPILLLCGFWLGRRALVGGRGTTAR
jgi:hypothetical protein